MIRKKAARKHGNARKRRRRGVRCGREASADDEGGDAVFFSRLQPLISQPSWDQSTLMGSVNSHGISQLARRAGAMVSSEAQRQTDRGRQRDRERERERERARETERQTIKQRDTMCVSVCLCLSVSVCNLIRVSALFEESEGYGEL
eukprot:2099529-Rhodomonas_salina.1